MHAHMRHANAMHAHMRHANAMHAHMRNANAMQAHMRNANAHVQCPHSACAHAQCPHYACAHAHVWCATPVDVPDYKLLCHLCLTPTRCVCAHTNTKNAPVPLSLPPSHFPCPRPTFPAPVSLCRHVGFVPALALLRHCNYLGE
eukprot:363565-Chlamydomonas_euryale.AAC.1